MFFHKMSTKGLVFSFFLGACAPTDIGNDSTSSCYVDGGVTGICSKSGEFCSPSGVCVSSHALSDPYYPVTPIVENPELVFPCEGDEIRGDTLVVAKLPLDVLYSMQVLTLSIKDNRPYLKYLGEVRRPPWVFEWRPTPADSGTQLLIIEAFNHVGEQYTIYPVRIHVKMPKKSKE